MNWRVLFVGLVLSAGIVILLAAGFGRDPRAIPDATVGKKAPDFELRTLQAGKPVSSDTLRGRPMVLNFWASWCQPCLSEHQVLIDTAKDPTYGNVQFLGVLYQDEPDKARTYLNRHGRAYPTLIDGDGSVAIDFGVTGVPETYFIDARGVIQAKHKGPLDEATIHERLDSIQ